MKNLVVFTFLIFLSFQIMAQKGITSVEEQSTQKNVANPSSTLIEENIDPPFPIPLDRPKVTKLKVKKKKRTGDTPEGAYIYDVDLQFASAYPAATYTISIVEQASDQELVSIQAIPNSTTFSYSDTTNTNTFTNMANGNYTFTVSIISLGEPIGSENGETSLSGSFSSATAESRGFFQRIGDFFRNLFS